MIQMWDFYEGKINKNFIAYSDMSCGKSAYH